MDQILFGQNPIPMLIYDVDTLQILNANDVFLEKYSYSKQEIEERHLTIKDIHVKEEIAKLLKSVQNLAEAGVNETGIFRHQSKKGEIFFVKIQSQKIPYKGKHARLVMCIDITAQVEAENKSAKAYEELQHHITNSPLASIKWDQNFRIKEWSEQAAKISGYEAKDVLDKNIFSVDFFEHAESNQIKKEIDAVVNGEHDRNQFETKIICKNGARAYIRIHSSALRNTSGELKSVLTLIEDISEQKKSEIKYQRLFQNANDSIFIMKDKWFVDCNRQAAVLFKSPKEEIIGQTPFYFSPEFQPDGKLSKVSAGQKIQKALKEGANLFEWQYKDSEGGLIDVEVSLNKVVLPDGPYLQAIVRDITDKKQTYAKMRRSEELFRNLFLKSPAALIMVDEKDRVQVVNDSFEKMFGYELKEVKNKNIDKLIVPPDEMDDAPKMKGQGDGNNYGSYIGEDFQIEGVRMTKFGEKKYVIIAGMPVLVNGELVAGLGMYIDITDRKESEKQLKKSLEEKRVLLEEVHHRVKNNLAVVSGLLQMQTLHIEDERLTKYMQNSQLRIQSMAIVHEMLYQSDTLSEIKFNNYIQKLADVISDILAPPAKNIAVQINADEFVLNVNQAIPCALIISELITNAYEYAFNGRKKGAIQLDVTEEESAIKVSIKDDGIGLPADFEEKRKKSLGINLIENLCGQLETVIQIESGAWGTRFHYTFEKTNKPGSSSSNRVEDYITAPYLI